MKHIYLVIVGCILLSSRWGYAQLDKKALKEIGKIHKVGDYSLESLDFHRGIEVYEEILKRNPEDQQALFKLGFCYLHSIHREKSLPYLKQSYAQDENYTGNIEEIYAASPRYINTAHYFLGRAYHFNNLFLEAIELYEKAIQDYETKKKEEKKKGVLEVLDRNIVTVRRYIQECKHGIEYINAPVDAQIDNIGSVINSRYGDYAPVISADESVLVFTSKREGTTGGNKDPILGKYYEDIYISHKVDGKWTAPKNIGRPVNSKTHEACIALSPDGKELFVYKDNTRGTGSIFVTDVKTDGSWEEPKNMGKNINTKSLELSISMTEDKKRVYFSSNRPGGFGGMDIYMSERDAKGNWGEAINLGKDINTVYDDDAPFITADGETLYFSSKGHATMGGYDIFKTSPKEGGGWTAPENLGFPINTADDDIYFVLSANGRHGYYASAKEGGSGEKDIYVITMPKVQLAIIDKKKIKLHKEFTPPKMELKKIDIPETNGIPKVILRGTIYDKETREKLEATINLSYLGNKEHLQDLTSAEGTGKYESRKVNFGKSYVISVQKEGYLFNSRTFAIPESNQNEEVIVDVELEKLKVGAKINLVIFFDFDKAHLRDASFPELERLLAFMQKHPKVKVEIAGHTDNIGTDQKNMILSSQRAKAVVNYLKKAGIPESGMIYKGYGFHQPVAPNQNKDGSDNPEGRQMNRRTECVVRVVE